MELHTTADGQKMLIAEMDNTHLLNFITSLCHRIDTCRKVIENPMAELKGNTVLMAINSEYSLEECTERAKDLIQETHKTLLPYCLEATLRGLEITSLLQDCYGREQAIPSRINTAIDLFFGKKLFGR
jgi:hypothetical protein